MNVLLAVLWKDLVTEWRGRDRAVATLLFSLLVVVIFHFSLDDGGPERIRELAPGLLWIAYVFAAVLGLNRAFSLELENDDVSAVTALALLLVERAGDGDRDAALNLLERIPESPETRRVAAMARTEPVDDIDASLADLLGSVKGDDASRQRFLDLLELLGPEDPRTAEWRRRLTSALF